MNREDIIRMARESGMELYGLGNDRERFIYHLERFAALVAAAERNSWPAEMEAMERQVNILTDALAQAKAEERQACAKVVEAYTGAWDDQGYALAAAIRAREQA